MALNFLILIFSGSVCFLVYILFGLGVVVVIVLRQSYIAEVGLGFLILLPLPPML